FMIIVDHQNGLGVRHIQLSFVSRNNRKATIKVTSLAIPYKGRQTPFELLAFIIAKSFTPRLGL
ncbi:MAG: hypothetical protein ACK47R_06470, partial [Planctomycetia bacterium]